jgi:micrococcal nuclease
MRLIALILLVLLVAAGALFFAPAQSGGLPQATVERVIDGDTIVVVIQGRRERVRYIGIDAPEMAGSGGRAACYAEAAAKRNEELVGGRTVGLEKDQSETDRFGRLLRYVYVGDAMVNAVLVREGFARAVRYPPDTRHAELLERLEREARAARRGLWGYC